MADYITKQLIGKPLDAVKNAAKEVGGKTSGEEKEVALQVAEDKRRKRFGNMEEERENLRNTIRDKYGLKKRNYLEVADADINYYGNSSRNDDPKHSDVSVGGGSGTGVRRSVCDDQIGGRCRQGYAKQLRQPSTYLNE